MTRTSRRPALVACVLAALLVAGCTSGGTGSPSSTPSSGLSMTVDPTVGRYVALGDSYSAGPLIPTTDIAGGCLRSDHNYPSLLARRLHATSFVDVTCSGATTHDLTHGQHTFGASTIPPQLRAVTRQTNLVTVGIGGNDLHLFSTLISTCTQLRASDPTGSPCERRLANKGPDLVTATRTISTRVAASLREIHRRAPRAVVVLVGYLRLVPDSGTCAALPLATGDYAEGRRISTALDDALRSAARRTGTRFVDMYATSRGHDICARDPWVNGSLTDQKRALAYHPFASGMAADAARVLGRVRSAIDGS